MLPIFPPEFFQPAELISMSERKQKVRITQWLIDNNVPHVKSQSGWPLVYRTALHPATPEKVQHEEPVFDYAAARRVSRRTTSKKPKE